MGANCRYLMRRKFPLKVLRWMSLHTEGDEGRKIGLNTPGLLFQLFFFFFFFFLRSCLRGKFEAGLRKYSWLFYSLLFFFQFLCPLHLISMSRHRSPFYGRIHPIFLLPPCIVPLSLFSASVALSLSLTAPIFHSVSPYATLISPRATTAATSVPHTHAGTHSYPCSIRSK